MQSYRQQAEEVSEEEKMGEKRGYRVWTKSFNQSEVCSPTPFVAKICCAAELANWVQTLSSVCGYTGVKMN